MYIVAADKVPLGKLFFVSPAVHLGYLLYKPVVLYYICQYLVLEKLQYMAAVAAATALEK